MAEAPSDLQPAESGRRVDLSADGGTLAFSAAGAERVTRLYARRLDQFEVTPLRDTEGAINGPFLSPDEPELGRPNESGTS